MTTDDLAISLSGVRFGWRPRQPVIGIDHLDVRWGERVFIEGPSGAGKSTLLALLGGIVRPQQGDVTVLGQPLHTLGEAARDNIRAERMGIIFQLFNLVPYLTLTENVLLPCRFSAARARKASQGGQNLQRAARELLVRLGLEREVADGRRAAELSVGQQQRVAAARALLGAPDLIIADEPTSALDHANRASFTELLASECERTGATLVFVSHDTTLDGAFDRRISLADINIFAREAA